MNYTYTIIIPHRNIPNLLQRCIDSIPQRKDTQIIIVDDNSDSSIVDFDNFPGNNRKNTKVIFSKKGGGAGYARNLALASIVSTKWVTFIDADDFLSNNADVILDKYMECESDIIFFTIDSVDSDTLLPSNRKDRYIERFNKSIETNNQDILRYKMSGPIAKFISYKLIKNNKIKFDETMVSNDVMFSLKTGHNAVIIKTDKRVFYITTERLGSLVKTKNYTNLKIRFYVAVDAIRYLKKVNKTEYHPNIFAQLYFFYKISFRHSITYAVKSFYYTPVQYWIPDIKECYNAFKDMSNLKSYILKSS